MAVKTTQKAPIDKELIKAQAREQVASRKLDRLKERYDKLQVITDSQLEKHAGEREKADLRHQETLEENEKLVARCKSLQDEAAMWKAQLFEQLDRLDAKQEAFARKQADFQALQTELAAAQWELVELVDLERSRAEIGLARSQAEVDTLQKALVASRARVDGLKNLGTCLAAKLERATVQRTVLQREHARLSELAGMRSALIESKDEEIEALNAELFEARRQLLSHRLDSQSWDSLKEGLAEDEPARSEAWDVAHLIAESLPQSIAQRPEGRRPLKLAAMPSNVSPSVPFLAPKQLLDRATKTVSGWFKIGAKH